MQHHDNNSTRTGRALVLGGVLTAGCVLAACSSGTTAAHQATTTVAPSTTAPTSTPTNGSGTNGSTTTTTGSTNPVTAAIDAFQAANGPATGWEITSTQTSMVDPTYVLFKLGPAPGYEATYQGGYGFVHQQGAGTWSVIGFGTSAVGCTSGGSSTPAVSTAVMTGFGLSCPS
ncbi:MAG: hypothetical protein ABSF84_17765 [Acidimicrobiales bacterium]|jgi:hypothetical protein